MFEVEFTNEFGEWWDGLDAEDQDHLNGVVGLLQAHGPNLGRPSVAPVKGSTIDHLKELRSSTLRVLFVFDPRRTAILLIGGDKRGDWKGWYQKSIPLAEQLYAEHLAELREEGEI
jgi:hypothetical protein